MNIELAKSAGFCFGVQRAIKMIYDALNQNKKICTLGNIIHNKNMINELTSKGVRVIGNINDAEKDETIVIRSHGVSNNIFAQLSKQKFLDATCPFVSKIHNIVSNDFINNKTGEIINKKYIFVIIIGDEKHPEIKGIEGHCIYNFKTIANSTALNEYLNNNHNLADKNIKVVVQTTYSPLELEECINVIKNNLANYEIFDTICNETKKRQTEASNMSKEKDLMIIVGDKGSSNTQKLVSVCKQNCTTYLIETALDIDKYDFSTYKDIGITAGASTPSGIIMGVINKLNEYKKIDDIDITLEDKEINFEEEFDRSLNSIYVGKHIIGTVTKISKKEAEIDIGNKYTAYLPLTEITSNNHSEISDFVNVGDNLKLIIININDVDGTVTLSKKRLDKIIGLNKIKEAYQNNTIIYGTVTTLVKDGVLVLFSGINVFIHQSQTCVHESSLQSLIDKNVPFKISYIDNSAKNIKGSIKDAKKDIFWNKVHAGDNLRGTVKNLTNFGAFIDLDGEDGLIFTSELTWSKIKHPSEILKVGDVVNVYVKHLDFDKKRVTLGYKKPENNPWAVIQKEYNIGDIVEVTILSLTPFGAFAEIVPGVEGLIHISEISNSFIKSTQEILKVGQKLNAKITKMDLERKRISLSIKSANE